LFAFEPVTSTKQISSPNTALNATAEMQPSADISENLGTQLIFQLIDAYISNRDEMCSASQLATKLLHHESSCASQLAAHASCLKSYETSYVFQLVAHAKCHSKSSVFISRLVVGFIQKFQSRLQQDLVDLSLSNAFSIAKLDSINTAILCNTFTLLVCEPVISNKPFRSLRLDRIKSKEQFTFQLIVGTFGRCLAIKCYFKSWTQPT
jgi:dGTP triphosphohydrolase